MPPGVVTRWISPQEYAAVQNAMLVPCLGGCGARVRRNLDLDHGVCGRCYEGTYGETHSISGGLTR